MKISNSWNIPAEMYNMNFIVAPSPIVYNHLYKASQLQSAQETQPS